LQPKSAGAIALAHWMGEGFRVRENSFSAFNAPKLDEGGRQDEVNREIREPRENFLTRIIRIDAN
jgi:hypothetical protein